MSYQALKTVNHILNYKKNEYDLNNIIIFIEISFAFKVKAFVRNLK